MTSDLQNDIQKLRAQLARIRHSTVLATIRAGLAFRLRSGKLLSVIVLSRQEAERLIEDITGDGRLK